MCVGEIDRVVDTYVSTDRSEVLEQNWNSVESAPGNSIVRVKRIRLIRMTETETDLLTVRTPFRVQFEFWVLQPALLSLSLHMKSISGEIIFAHESPGIDCRQGLAQFTCGIPGDFMNDGVYSIMMMIVKDSAALFILDDALTFEVHDVAREGSWWGPWPGVVRPKLAWEHAFVPDQHAGAE